MWAFHQPGNNLWAARQLSLSAHQVVSTRFWIDQTFEMQAMIYRADVDGLRAVAIASIVAFHVGIPGLQGGFVGVDIFFVISGFLISSILIDEIARSGSINLMDFYARRIRRLFPALFVVVMSTLVVGAILWTPIENLAGLADSAIATAAYLSNFYFWKNTGYFDSPAGESPLLHTWSLAVEEQFYLVWPLLAIVAVAAGRLRNRPLIPLLIAGLLLVFAVSFGISIWGMLYRPVAAFYLMPTRAWEFAIGGLVAVLSHRVSVLDLRTNVALSVFGLIAIGLSVFTFSPATSFPGIAALLPAFGTACVIAGGTARPDLWPTRILGSSILVRIGILSYSWYLWHWPLLTFTKVQRFSEPTILGNGLAVFNNELVSVYGANGLAVLVALCLAWATYRYIEHPIRAYKPGPFRKSGMTIGIGVAASFILIGGSFGLKAFNNYLSSTERYSVLLQGQKDWPPLGLVCHHGAPFVNLIPAEKCWQGSVDWPKRLVVWGDSHANSVVPLAAHFGENSGIRILQRTSTTCPPVLDAGIEINGKEPIVGCKQFNSAVLAEVEELSRAGLTGVILAARWPLYINQSTQFPDNQWTASFLVDNKPVGLEVSLKIFTEHFRSTLAAISSNKLRVLVVAPIPELRFPAPRCLAHNSNAKCSVSRHEAEDYRRAAVTAIRSVVSEFPEARLWDPLNLFCDQVSCSASHTGLPAYHDDNHISATKSRALLPQADAELRWLIANHSE